jgi:hypothetical protein
VNVEDEIVLPIVRLLDGDVTADCKCLYRRGVWAIVNGVDQHGAVVEDAFLIGHVPTGLTLGNPRAGALVLADMDTTINVVRALTPWAEYGAELAFGSPLPVPAELLVAANAARCGSVLVEDRP